MTIHPAGEPVPVSAILQEEPFFIGADGGYLPQACARGPWDPKSLHGRVIVGLLSHALEQAYGGSEFVPARLTVDMYRLPRIDPIEVKTHLLREGGRIRVAEAEFISAGVSMARASCQFLRVTEAPAGTVWGPPNWEAPSPDEIDPPALPDNPIARVWAMRPIIGAFGQPATVRRTWVKDLRDVVQGFPITPFERAAVASDFASPLAHSGSEGLGYINSDVTLYLHRAPVGEWIGFEKGDHQSARGVAVGECRLYDVKGPIGLVACAALSQRQALAGPKT